MKQPLEARRGRLMPPTRAVLCWALWLCVPLAAHAQAGDQTIIFQQPVLDGIAGNFHVPLAERGEYSKEGFNMLLWQPNPGRSDGLLIPSHRSVADKTGFQPSNPLEKHQAAFRDSDDTTTVQIDGDTVGVYLESKDLPTQSMEDKLMITPEFGLSKAQQFRPFEKPGTALVNSFELQIPMAQDMNRKGNFTYIVADFTFLDRKNDAKISYGVHIFHHSPRPKRYTGRLIEKEVGGFDTPSHAYQVGNPVIAGSRVVTVLKGSAEYQEDPWTGWRVYKFAITRNNFETALKSLKEQNPSYPGSVDPTDYTLTEWHLNAELKFGSGPAEMGWSMRHASVALVPENRLEAVR
jgi:hypothetical protein